MGTMSRSSRAIVNPTERTGSSCTRDREALAHHVAHAKEYVLHQFRLFGVSPLERPRGLGVDLAQPDGYVLVVGVDPGLQLGVADRRGNRVEVRVAVTRDVDPAPLDDLMRLGGHTDIMPRSG